MYLICHVTSHDHLIERTCEFMGRISLCYVTTLISLVTMSIVMVEMCRVTLVSTCLKDYVNLSVESRQDESPSCHV